jgi:hypothetical protein
MVFYQIFHDDSVESDVPARQKSFVQQFISHEVDKNVLVFGFELRQHALVCHLLQRGQLLQVTTHSFSVKLLFCLLFALLSFCWGFGTEWGFDPEDKASVEIVCLPTVGTGLHAFVFLTNGRIVQTEMFSGWSNLKGSLFSFGEDLFEVFRKGYLVLYEIVLFKSLVELLNLVLFKLKGKLSKTEKSIFLNK